MKQIELNLVGVNSNAFAIIAAFQRQAKREDWSKEEITEVLDEATSGDYDHLLSTILSHCY